MTTERGKHKRHTLKAQFVIDFKRGQFLAVATGKGRTHDLNKVQAHFTALRSALAVFS